MKNLSNINKSGLCFIISSIMTLIVTISSYQMSTWSYIDDGLYELLVLTPSILGFMSFFVGSVYLFMDGKN